MPSIIMKMQLGPLVSIQIEGSTCKEIAEALQGYEQLNKQVEGLCSGLADKVYPDAEDETPGRKRGGAK
jgi:hypothetical protein